MNREFQSLIPEQQAAVNRCIERARAQSGRQMEDLPDGGEAYAYQGAHGLIHWGFNGGEENGFCIARGVVS